MACDNACLFMLVNQIPTGIKCSAILKPVFDSIIFNISVFNRVYFLNVCLIIISQIRKVKFIFWKCNLNLKLKQLSVKTKFIFKPDFHYCFRQREGRSTSFKAAVLGNWRTTTNVAPREERQKHRHSYCNGWHLWCILMNDTWLVRRC